jgi:hypothetical protein
MDENRLGYLMSIFIDRNNTRYISDVLQHRIFEWHEGDIESSRIISANMFAPRGLFVTTTGDVYASNDQSQSVNKWTVDNGVGVNILSPCDRCAGVFIDLNNVLYCSMYNQHNIITKSLNSVSNMLTVVAGTGSPGEMPNMLCRPVGIFVNTNFDLYVADSDNNRIQLFHPGDINGITVAGTLATILLFRPVAIVLDVDNYLYIADTGNCRVVRSGLNGFQCLFGCYVGEDDCNEMYSPYSLAFDNIGNIYVTYPFDYHVQKYFLLNKTCSKCTIFTENFIFNISHRYDDEYNVNEYN